MKQDYELIIIGGGIAGLAAAFKAHKQGLSFLLVEASGRVGGCLHSQLDPAGFILEKGASSFALGPNIQEIIEILKLDFVEPKMEAKHKLIYSNGNLHVVTNPVEFLLKDKFLSWTAKASLLFGQGPKASADSELSVDRFFSQYFSSEICNKLIWALMGGIYAGDPRKLSINAVFPSLFNLAVQNRNLLLAALKNILVGWLTGKPFPKMSKRRIISFDNGLSTFSQSIAAWLPASSLKLNSEVARMELLDGLVKLKTANGLEFTAKKVIVATPAYIAAKLLPESCGTLQKVNYAPVASITLVLPKNIFPEEALCFIERSFGFLRARPLDLNSPEINLLGVVFPSSLFEGRAPEEHLSLTCFVGGMLSPSLVSLADEELFLLCLKDLSKVFRLNLSLAELLRLKHVSSQVMLWQRGIPQFELGSREIIDNCLSGLPSQIALAGNYVKGVSVEDTVKSGFAALDRLFG